MFTRRTDKRPGVGSDTLVAFVATVDAARARAFYEKVLGLKLVSEDPHALVFDAAGTKLRVSVVREYHPAPYTVLGWLVSDIGKRVSELKDRGVTFERFPGMTQDEHGIWSAPGGAKVAWFKDPEGNMLSLTQMTYDMLE